MPVKDIKKFIKIAKVQGVDKAIASTPNDPRAREYTEIEMLLKKLLKKIKQLDLEGINEDDLPGTTQDLLAELRNPGRGSNNSDYERDSLQ